MPGKIKHGVKHRHLTHNISKAECLNTIFSVNPYIGKNKKKSRIVINHSQIDGSLFAIMIDSARTAVNPSIAR